MVGEKNVFVLLHIRRTYSVSEGIGSLWVSCASAGIFEQNLNTDAHLINQQGSP